MNFSFADFITIFFIAVGLAMDAFAVSISNGVAVKDFGVKDSVKLGTYFGVFQFVMPILGWILGSSVRSYIEAVDHWIAFALLVLIGGNMLLEARKNEEEEKESNLILTPKILIVQAVATSIDALAVGISFAILDINILYAAAIIGIVAFIFSFAGGEIGKKVGEIFEKKAEILGGIILILIGLKILIEHLFF